MYFAFGKTAKKSPEFASSNASNGTILRIYKNEQNTRRITMFQSTRCVICSVLCVCNRNFERREWRLVKLKMGNQLDKSIFKNPFGKCFFSWKELDTVMPNA